VSRPSGKPRKGLTLFLSFGFSGIAVTFLTIMLGMFVWQSILVWRHEGFDYLIGKQWFFRDHQFGALPMIYGTIIVALIALMLAAPIGIGTAVFASEFLSGRLRLPVKIAVELLAGIPSVVYGLLGVLFLREWVYKALTPFDPLSGDTLLTAGLLLCSRS
jgi:phosphate transport system permease protein